jgi:hypothetical protein
MIEEASLPYCMRSRSKTLHALGFFSEKFGKEESLGKVSAHSEIIKN